MAARDMPEALPDSAATERELEEQWRAAFEANPTMYFIVDQAGAIVSVNPFGAQQLGYAVSELVGQPMVNVYDEPDRAVVLKKAESCFSNLGRTQRWQARKLRKDGTLLWVRETANAVMLRSRPILLVACEDVTEQQRAEQALRESEERFRTLVQFSFDVYWESDAQHRFVRQEFNQNMAYAAALGSELGRTRWEVPYLEPDENAWRRHRETLDAHLPFRDFELARPTVDGGKRYVSVSGLPVFDAMGTFLGYRGVGRDITERKRAQQALRDAEAALARVNRVTTLGVLAASIAHEVNQPLGAITASAAACTRWLAAQPPEMEKARSALDRIVADGRRAGQVVDRIRALVNRQAPRRSCVDLNEAILEVIALMRDEVHRNAIALDTSLAPGLPPVEGDRVQLQQVALNLVVNAIEAMKGSGAQPRELAIGSARDDADTVTVEVRDSGPGVDPGRADRLFEAFYSTKQDGIGMGLSISRSIIEAHGGRLWVTPNVPHGAAFRFSLPALHPVS